jgi:hypothetical protein
MVLPVRLEETVPDRSTFSRNRYGRFRESDIYRVLFENVVDQCRKAGLVPGEGFAVDGSFVHGDARRDLRVETVDAIRREADTSARPVRELTSAYLPRLNRSRRTSSAMLQMKDTILLCVAWSIGLIVSALCSHHGGQEGFGHTIVSECKPNEWAEAGDATRGASQED